MIAPASQISPVYFPAGQATCSAAARTSRCSLTHRKTLSATSLNANQLSTPHLTQIPDTCPTPNASGRSNYAYTTLEPLTLFWRMGDERLTQKRYRTQQTRRPGRNWDATTAGLEHA